MERAVGLVVGSPAPALTLRTPGGHRRALAELRGAPVVLAFADGWCGDAENGMGRALARLKPMNAAAVVVSDQLAWCARPESHAIEVYSRPGEITMRTYRSEPAGGGGVALVVIDADGVVRFAHAGSARHGELTDALSEALAAATRRLHAAHKLPKSPVDDWMVVSLVARFVLAFLECAGIQRPSDSELTAASATAA